MPVSDSICNSEGIKAKSKCLFQQTVTDATGPEDSVPVSDSTYEGSRRLKYRYEYQASSTAGFIELHWKYVLSDAEWRNLLEAVPGVEKVTPHPKGNNKEQNNVGDHCQEHYMVYSELCPSKPIEMGLTRNQHSAKSYKYTLSAMFKEQNADLVLEAWRILRAACKGKELIPAWVDGCSFSRTTYHRKVRARLVDSEGKEFIPEPGSASSSLGELSATEPTSGAPVSDSIQ